MTIQWGDTGKVITGPLKTFSFQLNIAENALGTITLPNAEGTTNQVSYTVQQSILPTITPNPVSMKYIACIMVSGKAVTAATVSYRIFKNGSPLVTSSSSISANRFYTFNHFRWYDVQVGDVLEVRCWSNQSDTTLDYSSIKIFPANVVLSKVNTILKDVAITVFNGGGPKNPNPVGASVRPTSVSSIQNMFTQISNGGSGLTIGLGSNIGAISTGEGVTNNFPYIVSHSLGICRLNAGGDATATTTLADTSSATDIRYWRCLVPDTISFREVLR